MKRMTCAVFMMVAALGCGGSDSPEDKCNDLLSTVCDRAVECVPAAGTESQCVQQLQGAIPCSMAQSVTASYDTCIDMIDSLSCATLFPNDPQTGMPSLVLPTECNGVIQVQRELPPGEQVSPLLEETASVFQ